MKKFFNWVSKNKGAIISVVLGLFSISELVFHWVLGNRTIYVAGFDVIGIAGVAVSILVGVLTSGFTSTSFQEAVDKLKETIKEDKANGLTFSERNALGKKVNALEKQKNELTKEYKPYIENVELFHIADDKDYNQYNIYKSKVGEIEKKINTLKEKLK